LEGGSRGVRVGGCAAWGCRHAADAWGGMGVWHRLACGTKSLWGRQRPATGARSLPGVSAARIESHTAIIGPWGALSPGGGRALMDARQSKIR